MKTIVTFTLLLISGLVYTGCQKEFDGRPLPNDQDSSLTGLLKKIISHNRTTGNPYSITEFEYDAEKRLKFETISYWDQKGNPSGKTVFHFFRDNTGKLIRIGQQPDTAQFSTFLHYNSQGQLQSAAVARYNGYQKLDSITLEYNSDGKIATWKRWGIPGNSEKVSYYFSFEYDANGNIIKQVLYQDTNSSGQVADGIYEPVITTQFEFDDKQNPYADLPELASVDWSGWDYAWFYSLHNPLKMKNDYFDPGSLDDEVTLHYTYDVYGHVLSLVQDQNVTPGDITEYYYY